MAYSNFVNNETKIKFYSGLQADLTTKITTGGAEEGAFYLTTDTHRLYVGRKVAGSDPVVVKAVQVSKGVTFVASSGDLPTPSAADVEEGELYYITDTNILAALVREGSVYKWTQINPPTGINTIEGNSTTSGNDVILTTEISTGSGASSSGKIGKTKFVAGSNITLTANGQETIGSGSSAVTAGKITIAATDTTYTLGSEATANGSTDGATIELCINGDATNASNTKINITGDGTAAVTSDASGNIVVHGPSFTGIAVEGKVYNANATNPESTRGMVLSLTGSDGDGAALSASGNFDPIIEYGQSGSKSAAHFQKVTRSSTDYIIADLDVYTKTQADTAINTAIDNKLATANAMNYKGVVTSAGTSTGGLLKAIEDNGGAHNGDVYKVGAISTSFSVNGVAVDTGDLIIITGTEATTGTFAGQILINSNPVSTSTSISSVLGYDNNGTLVPGICELIPSGDEPELTASTITAATGVDAPAASATAQQIASAESSAPGFTLYDGKNGGSDSTTNILTTRFLSGSLITVSANETVNKKSTGQDLEFVIGHDAVSRTDSTTQTLQNNGTSNAVLTKAANGALDTINTDTYELFVFSDPSQALLTDDYGHVTALRGRKINFKHNAITAYNTSYGVGASSGLISIASTDIIGNTPSASMNLKSSSLTLVGSNTSGSEGLSIDLTWGTF